MQKVKNKVALVLSGGGVKGSFQAGAIEVLIEKNIQFDAIFSVSVGALNGCLIAQNKWELLKKFWLDVAKSGASMIYTSEFINPNNLTVEKRNIINKIKPTIDLNFFINLFSKGGIDKIISEVFNKIQSIESIGDNTPLYNLLLSSIELDDFKIPFSFGAVSASDTLYSTLFNTDFDKKEELAKAILSSSTIPIIWSAKDFTTKDKQYTNMIDGGLRTISPLSDAIDYINAQPDDEEWTIIVINCSPVQMKIIDKKYNFISMADRCLNGIVQNQVYQDDIKPFLEKNNMVKQCPVPLYSMKGKQIKYFDNIIIYPEMYIGTTLDTNSKAILDRWEYGRKMALKTIG